MSDSGEGEAAAPVGPAKGDGLNQLFYVVGQTTPEQVEKWARWVRPAHICIENYSMEAAWPAAGISHISRFAPEAGEPSARVTARDAIARLSTTVLKSTGKPVWQSFDYQGISAWWFLDIVLQEPAYLTCRRKQALLKAAEVLGTMPALCVRQGNWLPLVPSAVQIPRKANHELRRLWHRGLSWMRRHANGLMRRYLKRRYLDRVGTADVLCIVEHENLRRHIDVASGSVTATLPYAEGIIEELHEALGDRCMVLSRHTPHIQFEKWEFLASSLPPLVYKCLSAQLEEALKEVFLLAQELIGGSVTLGQLREVLIMRLAEYDMYSELLDRIGPKVVLAYNWEGVFRPLTTAARVKNCKIIGVQQALGPYLHALDHREVGYFGADNKMGFALPDKFAVWGDFHRRQVISYGYPPEQIEVTGYARLDKHYEAMKASRRKTVCKHLGLDPSQRYLLFTGQARVLDTAILRDENFRSTLRLLAQLANQFNFKIIMKPWASDDLALFEEAARIYSELTFVAPQEVLVGNADLLSITDWLVGTFSSIMGEATLVGTACVLLNYPESRYYFDLPHVEQYRAMMPFVDEPSDLMGALRPLLDSEEERLSLIAKARVAMVDIFGPCDGQAAQRIAKMVLSETAQHA